VSGPVKMKISFKLTSHVFSYLYSRKSLLKKLEIFDVFPHHGACGCGIMRDLPLR